MCEREDTVVGCHVGRSTCVHVPFIRGGLRERRGVEGTREGRLVPLRGGAGEPTHRLLEAHGVGWEAVVGPVPNIPSVSRRLSFVGSEAPIGRQRPPAKGAAVVGQGPRRGPDHMLII